MMYVLGYNTKELRSLSDAGRIHLGRIENREDMDLTLQLLKLGLPNQVRFDIAADQMTGFGAKGGCSVQRTIEAADADAELLASLHPGLVGLVEKTYKGLSVTRKEVVVQWKRAYEMGKRSCP